MVTGQRWHPYGISAASSFDYGSNPGTSFDQNTCIGSGVGVGNGYDISSCIRIGFDLGDRQSTDVLHCAALGSLRIHSLHWRWE